VRAERRAPKVWRYRQSAPGERPYRVALVGDSLAYGMWAAHPIGTRLTPRLAWSIWEQKRRFTRFRAAAARVSPEQRLVLRARWMESLKDFCTPAISAFFTDAFWGLPRRLERRTGRPVEVVDLCAIGSSLSGAAAIIDGIGDEVGPIDLLVVCAANNHVVHADASEVATAAIDDVIAACARRAPGVPVIVVGIVDHVVECFTRQETLLPAIRMPLGLKDVTQDWLMDALGYRSRNGLRRGASRDERAPMDRLVRDVNATLAARERTVPTFFYAAANHYGLSTESGLWLDMLAVDGFHACIIGHQFIADSLVAAFDRAEERRAAQPARAPLRGSS
jgi:hypothetical protein